MPVLFLVFAHVPALQTTGEEMAEAEMGRDELPSCHSHSLEVP